MNITIVVLTGLIAGQPLQAQETTPEVLLRRLPALIDSAGIPGVALALLRDGKIAWTKGVGVRSAADRARVDQHTVFEGASLSKPVVAYIALKLVDAGRLELDRPLADYISMPELRDGRSQRITTRMVLAHTTGLQNELIGRDTLAFGFEPGERFRYSGEGFLLLQRVLASITGESLDRLAKRLVFDPLGMTRSSFVWSERFGRNAAVGHDDAKVLRRRSQPVVARASSSLHTTADDYALFARALMRGEGLSRASFAQMSAPQVQVAPGIAWGLGWSIDLSNDGALWHWGDNSNSGFTAFVWLHPGTGRGVVYFANSTAGLSIVRRITALVGAGDVAPGFMGYRAHDAPRRSQ
jgi:CubicO group peptidase (beta-lactamase class C family)